MALTKEKKQAIVDQVGSLLAESKMTVIAQYQGTPVKAMQTLRRDANENGTTVRVVKNRLVMQALKKSEKFSGIDTTSLNGMLLYAFNKDDEVAPAQALATFAKTQPTLQFIGAITADGDLLSADDVTALASLPTKEQLRAQVVGILAAPLSGFVNVLAGNIRGVLNALNARSEAIS